MNELDKLLALVGGLTGLTFEDVLAEASAETEPERQEAMARNVAKMSDYMHAQGKIDGT